MELRIPGKLRQQVISTHLSSYTVSLPEYRNLVALGTNMLLSTPSSKPPSYRKAVENGFLNHENR